MEFMSHLYICSLMFLLHLCHNAIHGFHFHALQIVENRDSICGRSQFYSRELRRCQKCSVCGPGYGVQIRCSATKDTECIPCTEGRTYSPHPSPLSPCRRCSKCKHREYIEECTPETDTVCGACEKGYYFYEPHQHCYKCSYCHPEQPGATQKLPECDVPGQRPDNQCLQLKHARAQREPPPMMRLSLPFFNFR